MGIVVAMKGVKDLPKTAPKSVRSTTEAVLITPAAVAQWKPPPFQRPLRVNQKVLELAEAMKTEGIVPGILTLGVLDREKYLVDGQHRIESFKLSEIAEAYAEIRICHFDSMADMAEEFYQLNSKIVSMRPDDILRALESTSAGLSKLREACDFIGYDSVRRGGNAPIVSMSTTLRCWFGSEKETPAATGSSAASLVRLVTTDEADKLAQFMNVAHGAWGRDSEYYRLWSALNMAVCMWLWRRTVIGGYSQKSLRMTAQQFAKAMMALSADGDYLNWLVGRNLSERDRSPCYGRIRAIVLRRLEADTGKRLLFPGPPWFTSSGRST
jgi:hypothetical protein